MTTTPTDPTQPWIDYPQLSLQPDPDGIKTGTELTFKRVHKGEQITTIVKDHGLGYWSVLGGEAQTCTQHAKGLRQQVDPYISG